MRTFLALFADGLFDPPPVRKVKPKRRAKPKPRGRLSPAAKHALLLASGRPIRPAPPPPKPKTSKKKGPRK